jgi:hypothetical protein
MTALFATHLESDERQPSELRKTPPPLRDLGEHKSLQVGGDWKQKAFIYIATAKAPQNALWAFWGTFAVAISFLCYRCLTFSNSVLIPLPAIPPAYGGRPGEKTMNDK